MGDTRLHNADYVMDALVVFGYALDWEEDKIICSISYSVYQGMVKNNHEHLSEKAISNSLYERSCFLQGDAVPAPSDNRSMAGIYSLGELACCIFIVIWYIRRGLMLRRINQEKNQKRKERSQKKVKK